MLRKNSKVKGLRLRQSVLMGCGVLALVGTVLIASPDVSAADVPSASVTIGGTSADRTQILDPGDSNGDARVISVPVTASFSKVISYSVGVSLDCTGKAAACANSSALIGESTGAAINGTTQGRTRANLVGTNTWGFYADLTNNTIPNENWVYNKMPVATNTTNIVSGSQDGLTNGDGKRDVIINLAAGVSSSLAADNYQGRILVSVVAEPMTSFRWTIYYDLAGGTGNTFTSQTGESELGATSATATLRSGQPTRTGYVFKNWKGSDGKTYSPGAAVTFTGDTTLTLTAVWEYVPLRDGLNMQDVTSGMCSATTKSNVYTLTDSRDGKKYLVGRLEDGKCWMLQNLALAGGTTLNTTTSNVSYRLPSSNTIGFESNTEAYMYNGSHTDGAADSTSNTGAYYSFLAATAGTGTGDSGNASGNICPKGWRLPTGGPSGEFVALAKAYGGTGNSNDANIKYGSNFSNAYKAALVGIYLSSSLSNGGSYGRWWSSTIYNGTIGYDFSMGTSNGTPQGGSYKKYGSSVRCIFGS